MTVRSAQWHIHPGEPIHLQRLMSEHSDVNGLGRPGDREPVLSRALALQAGEVHGLVMVQSYVR